MARKKRAAFTRKLMASSNNRKFLKKRGRRKIMQPIYKWKRSVIGNASKSDGNSISLKIAGENYRVPIGDRRVNKDFSRDSYSSTNDNIERKLENEPIYASDNDTVQDTYKRVQANDFPKSWTTRMIQYYFKPNDKCKNFDHLKIMNKIEYKASDWWINDADRIGCRKSKEFFQRCAKCNQKGHTKKKCKKPVVCYVCGEFNHRYSDCPNVLCFTCGRATKKYSNSCRQCRRILNCRRKCALCGQVWHEENLCPSKWRKYLTVTRSQSSHVFSFRLNSKKYCYNCAQSGHFGFECPLVSQSDYPPENPLKTAFPLGQRYAGDVDDIDNANVYSNSERDYENLTYTSSATNVNLSQVHVIFLAKQVSDLLSSEIGRRFLSNLSHNTNARVELFRGKRFYLKVFGDDQVVDYCRTELVKWKTP